MTFVLHPLFHYNSITKPRAHFLLSLFKGLTTNFPSHFILFLMDVYKDTATCNKLIFPSTIMRIICHDFMSYPESTHFTIMCAISGASVRQSEAQLQPKWPQIETMTPLASSTPSTSVPFSFMGGVTLKAIMDAHLDTFSDELCQVNTRVSRIAWQQAVIGGFTASPSPSPQASKDEGDDDGSNDDDEGVKQNILRKKTIYLLIYF